MRLAKALDFATGANTILKHSRISIAWLAVGIAAGAYEAAFEYCQKRQQFGKPIAGYQLIQEKLVRALAQIESIMLLCHRVAYLYQRGHAQMGQIAMTKAQCSRVAREVCALAREIMGGNGILIENRAMVAMTDVEAAYTYEGTYDINTLVAGRELTGFAAFK